MDNFQEKQLDEYVTNSANLKNQYKNIQEYRNSNTCMEFQMQVM